MDPLAQLRGDIPVLDPLARARLHGQAAEEREWQQAAADRQAAVERFQASLWQQEAIERSERARDGYSQRELAEHQRAVADAKAERIQELEAEIGRLDPARRGQLHRTEQPLATERLLARARAAGPDDFMRREIAAFEHREEIRRSGRTRDQIRRLEDERAGPMIYR